MNMKMLKNLPLIHYPNNSNVSLMLSVTFQKKMVWKNSGRRANHSCNNISIAGEDAPMLKANFHKFCMFTIIWIIFRHYLLNLNVHLLDATSKKELPLTASSPIIFVWLQPKNQCLLAKLYVKCKKNATHTNRLKIFWMSMKSIWMVWTKIFSTNSSASPTLLRTVWKKPILNSHGTTWRKIWKNWPHVSRHAKTNRPF